MVGKNITKLSYEVGTKATSKNVASYNVYLEEVTTSVYPSKNYDFLKSASATLVYTGGLDATGSNMEIVFDNSFLYTGSNNLLVHIECTSTGDEGTPYFRTISDWSNCRGIYTGTSSATTRTGVVPKTTITYETPVLDSPVLSVTPDEACAFGVAKGDLTKTYTIANTGVNTMDVSITSSNNTEFSISPTSITNIVKGSPQTFTVTFHHSVERLEDRSATITVTPTNYDGDPVSITASAFAKDPSIWEEDFSDGIPSSWYNQGNSWSTSRVGYIGAAGIGYAGTNIELITPKLQATKDQVLKFDVLNASASYNLKAEYCTDRVENEWEEIGTYSSSGTKEFTAPSTDNYWIRFTGNNTYIDNLVGFSPTTPTHNTAIQISTIPTTCNQYLEANASVTLLEYGGTEEDVTIELYIEEEKVASVSATLTNNTTTTVNLAFTPRTVVAEGEAYIHIYNDDIDLTTDPVDIVVNGPEVTLDETQTPVYSTGAKSALLFKYTAQNGWNTICVPFSLNKDLLNNILGTGWTMFDIASFEDNILSFSKVTSYSAGFPYLVHVSSAASNPDGVVILNPYLYYTTARTKSVSENAATFNGTFAPVAAPGMDGKYGVTTAGRVMKGTSEASIKGFRAYFTFADDPNPSRIALVFNDDDEALGLSAAKWMSGSKDAYNLQGQRVEKGRKGIFIVNGRKVIIK